MRKLRGWKEFLYVVQEEEEEKPKFSIYPSAFFLQYGP